MLNIPFLGLGLMNTKTILGVSFAAVFALTMVLVPAYSDGHLAITKTDVKVKTDIAKGTQTLDAKIKTSADIPTDGSDGFGYGLITGTNADGYPENVLALTTHMCAADHPLQSDGGDCPDGTIGILNALAGIPDTAHNGAEFHAHILDLKPATASCVPYSSVNGLEVDVPRTFEGQFGFPDDDGTNPNNNVLADYDIKVHKNKIDVKKVPVSDLFDSGVEAIVSFGLAALDNEIPDPDNLGAVLPGSDGVIDHICLI